MGLFGNQEQNDMPPRKNNRLECWNSKDEFFECLTYHNIDNSLDPKEKDNVESNCGTLRNAFQDKCVASWYRYFQEKRFGEIQKERYIKKLEAEGAQPLPFKLSPRK